ncbi:LEAF RUST 10 DISEASE-RESISTANCE LOCUS RECEPTOR-LIKE PROTEIN KINASE-like 1.1 isoform X2 [Vitis vinifera]|uniref:LEAF RUST 10 DISEASE-RESISTANCE LOCUS RECEPTOR-LIKE PROTEIN KINASE-like 1.1 isoform X2 n=1 Tax=Vitis vinifera TaxID=29760 RepID=UPI00053F8BDF|nr:LEAF RUST 10 DISEASE-RESISTANCE LOCUS RECEPTOR-LIKE PROTEIN KINASE-like 1.1 isoform X2 [Vitis vinifera]|eukprot:XP_010644067.1 PREDICTED: LEAF RUST 10 DISEASE-RESISTANCE LOCUS RECEPTOR-LIKE PROTEIN KINASE-like 1.1 isoform X4 [Vitis vinifera]
MMPSQLHSSSFLFFISVSMFVLVSVSSSPDHNYFKENCSSQFYCGSQEVQDPFWTEDGIKECCRPGMAIKCENNHLEIEVMSGWYRILSITQETRTLKVERTHSRDDACDKKLADDINGEVPNCSDGSFEYHCSSNENLGQKFTCNKSGMANEVFSVKDPILKGIIQLSKDGIAIQAQHGHAEVVRRLSEVFSKPFELEYEDDGGDCYSRLHSNGSCGHNWTSQEFTCFCSDHPRPQNCLARNDKTLKLALGLGIVGSIPFLIICFFIIRQRRKGKYASTFLSRNTSSDPSSQPGLETAGAYFGIAIFPYTELEEATNYFDPDREIGDGGFGSVYHGQLRDGREVAVKRLYENNYRRVEQFMNEVQILTRLRHRNLVSLYGCTSRHSRELLLVYEFIPNGTVADHLHGDRADSGLLTWPIRLSIAIETATALCYLHASDVVHRDVKTSNILLDNSFCVKVADFGLSRLFPTDVTHVSTAPQGTPGYVDPEYHQCYQLTDKSDVYSFGVVLIELISSLPAVDISRHRHEINLSNYAINKIQKCAFHELMDPHLGFDSDLAVNRMTTLVAELAFRCLQPDKEMRPSMDEVLEILKEIESDKHELENMDTAADSVGSSMRKPPSPSPDCDEVGLLKSAPLMPSPDTVIARWPSMSTTPSASA